MTDEYYEVCTSDPLEVTRPKGKSGFTDATKQLLTILLGEDICVDENNDTECEIFIPSGGYTIFDDIFEDYFWEYDNNRLRLYN